MIISDDYYATHTLKGARAYLRDLHGMSLTRTECDEYRVTFAQGSVGGATPENREATTYYTDDLQDAITTGVVMRARSSTATTAAKPSRRSTFGRGSPASRAAAERS